MAPLANGTSLPATETVIKNLRRLGFESDLDEDALAAVSAHFRGIAEREGLPVGRPMEYDLFHFEHQVPGGMVSNFVRQLRELNMEDRLDEILEEAVRVRREYGYPVMATPYSQIVGAQAFENVVSGERYGKVTDESIKYLLGYYGQPAYPLDEDLMERVAGLPRTREFLDWKPEGYLKTIDELRRELGPDLSDDDLLLKVLIPGRPVKRGAPAKPAAATPAVSQPAASGAAPAGAAPHPTGLPREYAVEVDGDVFTVRISPLGSDGGSIVSASAAAQDAARGAPGPQTPAGPRELPEGAILCGAPGLILSLLVQVGDAVAEGDEIALIETMKMKRPIVAPCSGVVRETPTQEGQMVAAEDVLMVVI